jgi:hypothetical protein
MMRENGTSIYIMDLLCIDYFALSNFIFHFSGGPWERHSSNAVIAYSIRVIWQPLKMKVVKQSWIPAFAGMTNREILSGNRHPRVDGNPWLQVRSGQSYKQKESCSNSILVNSPGRNPGRFVLYEEVRFGQCAPSPIIIGAGFDCDRGC